MSQLRRRTTLMTGSLSGIWLILALTFQWPPMGMIYAGPSLGSCRNELKTIAMAKSVIADERGLTEGDTIPGASFAEYFDGKPPKCPAGGIYHIGRIGEAPRCTLAGTDGPPSKKKIFLIWWRWEIPPAGRHEL